MTINVGISGFGRIGKLVFRIIRYLLSFSMSMLVKISLLTLVTIFTSDELIE